MRAPVLGVLALTGLAWIGLALAMGDLSAGGAGAASSATAGPPWMCMPGMGGGTGAPGGPAAAPLAGMPMWSLMAVAMMLPLAVPASGHVALHSTGHRRWPAVAELLVSYLAPWLAFGALVLFVLALVPIEATAVALAATLAVAALWEFSPAKRRALERGRCTVPLPPRGWRASAGTVRFGFLQGSTCVASCWPLMLVMAIAPSTRLAWCAGLSAVGLSEQVERRPRQGAHWVGALLGVAAAAALALPW